MQVGKSIPQKATDKNNKDRVVKSMMRMDLITREQYLREIMGLVKNNLAPRFQNIIPKYYSRNNYIHFYYLEFPRSHYELTLARKSYKFAFHLEGGLEENLSRLAWIKPHLEAICQQLNYTVTADRWGKNWAQILLEIPYHNIAMRTLFIQRSIESDRAWPEKDLLDKIINDTLISNPNKEIKSSLPLIISAIMVRFIETTCENVQEAFQAVPGRRVHKRSFPKHEPDDGEVYKQVDEQIQQIRLFLAGRLATRPADEQLCDWVQFCYLVGLYNEGARMFEYIDMQLLNNDWLYKRTNRYAQACRLNANIKK